MKNILYTIFLILIASNVAYSQSDVCSVIASLPELIQSTSCVTTSGSTSTGFTDSGTTTCVNGTEDDDGWYRFVATATSATITVDGASNFDGVVGLFTGCGTGQIGSCIDNTVSDGIETLSATGLTVGNTYVIQVYDYSTGGGEFTICVTSPPPPPANDNCSGAISATVNTDDSCTSTVTANTAGATNSGVTPSGACTSNSGTPDDDIWFSFVAPSTSVQIIGTNVSGSTDVYYQVFSAACGGTTTVICSDTNSGVTATGLTVGATYYLRFYTWGSGVTTNYTLCFKVPPPPADCTDVDSVTPVCTDTPLTFPAGVNQVAAQTTNPSIGYDCLLSTPNPAWYYLEIGTSGTLSFDISNSASLDVDWAAWGPFSDVSDLTTNCGTGGTPFDAPIDCNFLTASSGVIDLGTVIAGEVYAILVTNFSNSPTNITMATTAGSTGSTDCSILLPCDIGADTGNDVAYCYGETPGPIGTDLNYDDTGFDAGPNATANAAVMFAEICGVYNPADDTTPGDPTSNINYTGFLVGQSYPYNPGLATGVDGEGTGCEFITLVPMTVIDASVSPVLVDGDPANICTGTPLRIDFRPEITASGSYDCGADEIVFTPDGGSQDDGTPVAGNYTVDILPDPNTESGQSVASGASATFTNLANGSYTITVTDSDGCTQDFALNVACAGCPVIDYSTPMAVCSGEAIDFTVGAGCTGFTGSGNTGTFIDIYYYYDGTTTQAPAGYESTPLPFGATYPDPFNDGDLTPIVSDGLCVNQQDLGWTNNTCAPFIASYFAFVFDYDTDANGDTFGDYTCSVYRYDVTIYPAQPTASVTNNTACGQPTVKLLAADGTTECIADAPFGTAATAVCATGNTTENSSGTFTAAQIATALGGVATCYVDEPYSGSSSCPNVAPATADAGTNVSTTCTDPIALAAMGTGTWSGGAGAFSSTTDPNATYTPTTGEAGSTVTLTWTVAGTAPCPDATDMVDVTVAACPACPDLSMAAPMVQITNSSCSTVGGTPSGGSINAPAAACPSGSSIQYSLTNNGTDWSAVLPTYDQDGPAQTVYTRCLCGLDGSTASPASSLATVPGTCPAPSFTFTITDPCSCNNDQPADNAALNGVGSFAETVTVNTGAGAAGAGLSLYVSAISAHTGATAPTGIAVNDLLTDNGDGTYSITFTHYDGTGYTIEVSWDQDNDDNPATGTQQAVGTEGNRCGYPSANIAALGPFDNCAAQADVALSAVIVDGGGIGASVWGGTGVSGTNFNPSGLAVGTATINLTYTGADNGNVSPDNGTTVVYPGCEATSTENVTITACPPPACNADNGDWTTP